MSGSDEKKCPFCAEIIKAEAIKCRFCGELLEIPAGSDLSQAEHARQALQGHALGTDTEVLFEGNISWMALVGPTMVTIFWIIIAILIGNAGNALKSPGVNRITALIGSGIAAIALLYWIFRCFDLKNRVFRITNDRVEYEHGILSKAIHNMDLWRVQDIRLNASFMQRLFGLGRIIILSSDRDTPTMTIGPIHDARQLYDRLKKVQLDADRRRGVVHIEK